ncbi:MAG: PAS domain S-box protein, partial [Geminicoccaceae bacterium]|nr:PAS domain S-box protein [Geminicoccaceae bacterium]
PVFAIQVLDLVDQREQRRERLREQALQLARLAAAQQDQFVEGARYLLAAVAGLPEVKALDAAGCDARMIEFQVRFPSMTGIGIVGLDGRQICSSNEIDPAISIADREYFQTAIRSKSLALSGYIIGRRTGMPHLNFAYPVLDEASGEVSAVAILAYGLDRVAGLLMATELPPGGSMSLIDGSGILLARAPPAPEWIGKPVQEAPLIMNILTRREGAFDATGIDGVERVYGFAPLLASSDLFAVVGLPWREVYAAADHLFRREVAFTALAFLLAMLVALIGAEVWIRRPIGATQAAVRRLAAGDLTARAEVPLAASPELRELGASFNDMARSLGFQREAVIAGEARFRAVVETAPDGIVIIDEQGIIQFVNPSAERLFGHPPGALLGRNVACLMPEPDRSRHDGYIRRYRETGDARIIGIGRDVSGQRQDGTSFPMSLAIGEFRLDRRHFFAGIVRDITVQKQAEERQKLLMAELDHRAKNLLATMRSMTLLSRQDAGSVEAYATTLVGRLGAMARAHDLLAKDRWEGARLHELIRIELAAYAPRAGDALRLEGDDIVFAPPIAQTIALVLHELTTNAAKYGALSRPGGTISVTVRREARSDGPWLHLDWVETGGPAVAPPSRRGFGSVLIERSIVASLDGQAEFEFDRTGFRCRIEFPLPEQPARPPRRSAHDEPVAAD